MHNIIRSYLPYLWHLTACEKMAECIHEKMIHPQSCIPRWDAHNYLGEICEPDWWYTAPLQVWCPSVEEPVALWRTSPQILTAELLLHSSRTPLEMASSLTNFKVDKCKRSCWFSWVSLSHKSTLLMFLQWQKDYVIQLMLLLLLSVWLLVATLLL